MPFGEFAVIQPFVSLERGTEYPFIAMEDVEPKRRAVFPGSERVWDGGGGARFENGDVLFARITPCLEHGKTVQVQNLATGAGFGSTEFFVFRGRECVSDSYYIYYLACSDALREPAIKSMVGASGRQRAQRSVVEETMVPAPPLAVQCEIADILCTYDDLIENNRRRMVLLEDAARQLYREWFVRLRFPGHEHTRITKDVPEGWEQTTAYAAMEVLSGGTPKTIVPDYWEGDIPFYTPKDATDTCYVLETERYITELGLKNCNSRMYSPDTVFISARGTVGKLNLASRSMAMSQSCYALIGKGYLSQLFLFCALKEAIEHFKQHAVGAVFDAIVVDTFKLIPFLVPDKKKVRLFEEMVTPMFRQMVNIMEQNKKLRAARDLLLPRLMNGEINV
jgi:type I restriction enzyme, S subunit